jgi:hypothetical protein
MRENYSCRKVIYKGDIQRPEKVNDTCMKTIHAGKWIQVSLYSHYKGTDIFRSNNSKLKAEGL